MTPDLIAQGAARLDDWGVIRARGADAASFLHGQLTNGVTALDGSQARLAGYCSAKGRLLASFVVWKSTAGPSTGDLLLACHGSLLPATLKRLSMFVLRAKCLLSDASAELPLWGLAGASAVPCVDGLAVWGQRDTPAGSWIRLPDAEGLPRALQVAGGESASPPSAPAGSSSGLETASPTPPPLALGVWRWLDVLSGVPTIESATADQFVPQMLNFELLGGVDFQKGCYPGQEVVARSQYRGTVKRRMFRFACTVPAAAGDELFHSGDPSQPCGRVCNAAARPPVAGMAIAAGGDAPQAACDLLAEVKLAALEGGSLHLRSADGPLLTRVALPYDVPAAESAA